MLESKAQCKGPIILCFVLIALPKQTDHGRRKNKSIQYDYGKCGNNDMKTKTET